MKIIYARTQFWFNLKSGGSVGHTLGVLNGFEQNNCKIKIIANERFLGIDDFDYFIIEPKIKRPLGELLYNFYASGKFKNEVSKFKPDFIYHRYTGYTFFVAKIAKELNIPLVLEFNSFFTWFIKYLEKNKNLFKKFVKRYLLHNMVNQIEFYNLKNASLVVSVSKPLKTDLLRMGIPAEKILVNPNGVDPEKFNPEIANSKKCRDLREKLGLYENKILVGFSALFRSWHGIPQLTETIDEILKTRLLPNIHFLLIGDDGQLKADMEKQLGEYKEVTFTGTIPYSEIQYYLAICDILVSPHGPQAHGREFFFSPIKLFEYMAMGKGIVASNVGQIAEVLKDSENAILVEPGNVDELINGILKLARDKDLRQKLGKNARYEVIKNYTWRKHVKKVIDSFKEISLKS